MYQTKLSLLLLTSLLLTACGGGGENNTNNNQSNLAPITDSTQVASAVSATSAERTVTSVFLGTNAGVLGTPLTSATGIANSLFKPKRDGNGIAFVGSDFCSQGSIDLPSDPNAMSGTISFNSCTIAGTNFVINGSISFSASGTGSSFTLALNFNGLTISENAQELAAFNGSITMSLTASGNTWTSSVTVSNLNLSQAGEALVLANYTNSTSTDWSTGETSTSFHYTVTSASLGGTLIVTTNANEGGSPVLSNFSNPYPYSGTIIIIGGGGDRARITINGGMATDTVVIEYDLDADSVYDDGINVLTWPQFMAQGHYLIDPVI